MNNKITNTNLPTLSEEGGLSSYLVNIKKFTGSDFLIIIAPNE